MDGMRSVLLVEDDETTRDVLTVLFEADGWTVQTAESGEAAVALLQQQAPPEVVLCDLHLPGVQGTALANRLREAAPGAEVLAMTASDASAPPAGYAAVLRKPFGPAEVRAVLNGCFSSCPGVSTTKAAGEEVLNAATMLSLRQQMGGRAKELYAFALADAQDRIRHMRRAVHGGDNVAYRGEAHALKGSAAMVGAQRLAVLAEAAEKSTVNNWAASADTAIETMQLACEELHLALQAAFPV